MKIYFTFHAKHRMSKRKIPPSQVTEAIKFPDLTTKKQNKYYFKKTLRQGSIEVCCEKTENNIKVITVYWI